MPPIIIAFFVLSGLVHGDTLVRGRSSVLQGRDPATHLSTSKTPVTYTATTAPWRDARADKKGGCDFQLLARVTGRGSTRARVNMIEQLVDESWTPRFRIKGGERATFKVEFLEPAGDDFGTTIRELATSFKCHLRDGRVGYIAPDMSGVE